MPWDSRTPQCGASGSAKGPVAGPFKPTRQLLGHALSCAVHTIGGPNLLMSRQARGVLHRGPLTAVSRGARCPSELSTLPPPHQSNGLQECTNDGMECAMIAVFGGWKMGECVSISASSEIQYPVQM